ncbi:phosphoglycolate phosphatase [Allopusillimonas soli]|uniref:phosphoglycolate phosphatase n=1 Tax=Allopusillimonas soli TaxID=659016 RepID=A0A853F635_9BURK|nr:phosphoglycolate phosphatase [Allopusillimonas soli]NYT35308.1 phosphoglycolate phosphatase [Allopusillimonas soli]TEA75731.1 phosphoglycolate phosphatase [Allopusillimonas soli]
MNKLVLFDFDGTLADTAPDLAAAANKQRDRRGLPPLPYEALRPYASHGARGLLRAGLGLTPDDDGYEACRQQFLDDYRADMTRHTTLFPGVSELLATLRSHGYAWGIVTNKAESLALPLVAHLGLEDECAVTVGGDTTPHAKPHPEPLLHAARKTGHAPQDCIYIGDDQRDIIAGKAAGMGTVVAAYGYCGTETAVHNWDADAIANAPKEIWPLIRHWSPPA